MAENSTLGLLFEISTDPSKALMAVDSFRGQASQMLKEFENQLATTVTRSIGLTKEFAIGMAVGVGAVASLGVAMFELAKRSAEVGEKIFEMHERTGFSSASLSGLMAIAKETGGSMESLSMGLSRATVNLTKMIDAGAKSHTIIAGLMGGAKGLADLGLKPMEDRLQTVLHRIFELNDVGERNRALSELMGRGWMQNVEALKILGEQGYAPAIEQAKKFGLFFDDAAAAKAKQFMIEMNQLELRVEALAMIIGQTLIPKISAVMLEWNVWVEYLRQAGPWQAATGYIRMMVDNLGILTGKIIGAIPIIGGLGRAIEGVYEKRLEQMATDKTMNQIFEDQIKLLDALTNEMNKQAGIDKPKAVGKSDTGEKKRLIQEELAAAEKAAADELAIQERLNKQLFDSKKDSLLVLNAMETDLNNRNRTAQYAAGQTALEKWYNTQKAALMHALDEEKAVSGTKATDYQALVNKISALDDQMVLKHMEMETHILENSRKAAEEIVEFNQKIADAMIRANEGVISREESELKAHNALVIKEMTERVKIQVQIVERSADQALKLEREHAKILLDQHRISRMQYIQQEKQLLEVWYRTHMEVISRSLAAAKSAYGEESAEYQRMVEKKIALDEDYASKSAQIKDQEVKGQQDWEKNVVATLGSVGQALQGHQKLQRAVMISKAAIEAAFEIAESIKAYAHYDFWAGTRHAAAAAAFLAVGGGSSSGGGGGTGGSSGQSTASVAPTVAPTMAPGTRVPAGGTVHVLIMGSSEAASWIAGVVDHGVRYQGVKLTASHSLRPAPVGTPA